MKQNRNFVILGVTGGAGSGKTTIVKMIQELVPTVFLHCDVIAHELMEPGQASYAALVEEFGEEILEPLSQEQDMVQEVNLKRNHFVCKTAGEATVPAGGAVEEKAELSVEKQQKMPWLRKISRPRLSSIAMATEASRKRLNELTHPLVQQAVEAELDRLAREQFQGVVVVEAALLIEAGFQRICDFLWYVHAPVEDRIQRMREIRGYSEEKIANILAGQLTEAQFLAEADVVIENPDIEIEEREAFLLKQIERYLKECLESPGKM